MPSPITASKTHAMVVPVFRSARAILAVSGVSALLGACSTTSPDRFRDVGNMAYPEPLSQGNLRTTVLTGCPTADDTGSNAYPKPLPEGNLSTTGVTSRLPIDTGNMIYSEPVSAGSIKHAAIAARC